VRRIVEIDWKPKSRGISAQNSVVTALVALVHNVGAAGGDENAFADDEINKAYIINDTLHDMIRGAPVPYNY